MTMEDNKGFVTMSRNRHNNDTVKLTIRGREKLICKWDIRSKCTNRYCKNDHLNEYEQLCSYYMKGYCSFDKSCKLLHVPELYPFYQYYGRVPHGCKIITLNNNKVCVCEKWIEGCKLPSGQRKQIVCYNTHQYNDSIFRHLNIPICEEYLNGKCTKRLCTFPHPPELSTVPIPPVPIVPQNYVRVKKALCVKHLLHFYDGSNEDCQRGHYCNYAHSDIDLYKLDFIQKIDHYLVNSDDKMHLQEILMNYINVLVLILILLIVLEKNIY